MLSRPRLIVVLIAAIMVGTSVPKNVLALTPDRLPNDPLEQAELIISLIRLHAPNQEVGERMVAIASCESTGFAHTVNNGQLVRNGNVLRNGRLVRQLRSDGGFGVLQIMPAHISTAQLQGLNIVHNVHDYIAYAYWLYHERRRRRQGGLEDWNPSRHCWHGGGRMTAELAAHRRRRMTQVAEAR